MTPETRLPAAVDRVDAERTAVERKRDAYDSFVARVQEVSVEGPREQGGRRLAAGAAGGTLAAGDRSAGGAAATVREAFRSTVGSVLDEESSTAECIAAELGDEVAVALASAGDAPFTPERRDAVATAASKRRLQLSAMSSALDREAESLAAAQSDVETVHDWLRRVDRTPLPRLGFDELRERHERLDDHVERCARRLAERQSFLSESTGANGQIGLEHQSLVAYLYEEFEIEYPVLAGVARTARVCRQCQRAVRAHLTRCG